MSKKVFIKTIPRPTATKISEKVVNKHGVKLNQTKISAGIPDRYMILLDGKTGRLATGLNRMVDNPYYTKEGAKKKKSVPKGFEFILDQPEVKEQHLLEIKHKVPYNYYTDEPANPKSFERTFLQEFYYFLNDGTTEFSLDKSRDEIAYYVMLNSKKFANSKKELDEHKYPDAIYYISSKSEDEEEKMKKNQLIDVALATLAAGNVSDSETRRKVVTVLFKNIKNTSSVEDVQIYNMLSENIKNNPKDPNTKIGFVKRFNKIADLLQTPHGKEKFEAMVFLQQLRNNWVVAEKQGAWIWQSKDMRIGSNYDQALNFLLDPEKQDFHEQLNNELKGKSI